MRSIASYIDHTILKPDTIPADIEKLCREAIEQQFAAVCVPPLYVPVAGKQISGTAVKLATVIGFPFGYSCTDAKIAEINKAIDDGADELDFVHNIAALKSGDWHYLENEIRACLQPVRKAGKIIKVIVESGLLNEEELLQCCKLYSKYDIDYIKTATGYAAIGATVQAVKIMRSNLPANIKIKASGGIQDFVFASELIAAGASRIGTSSGMRIVAESKAV